MSPMPRLSVAVLAVLSFAGSAVAAGDCYYPNGDKSSTDYPCSDEEGSMCCPYNWQCLDNGLCWDPNAKYFGRYTCSDQTWESPACPNICTQNLTAVGNEAILQCSNHDDLWCCDADRVSFDCCTDSGHDYWDLANGTVFATILSSGYQTTGSGSVPTSIALKPDSTASTKASTTTSSSNAKSSASKTATSGSAAASATTATASAAAITSTVESTNAGGTVQTVVVTQTPGATLDPQGHGSGSNKHLGTIVGCAVGIPVGLACIIGGILFFLWRRRKGQKAISASTLGAWDQNEKPLTSSYAHGHTPSASVGSTAVAPTASSNSKVAPPVGAGALGATTVATAHSPDDFTGPAEIDGREVIQANHMRPTSQETNPPFSPSGAAPTDPHSSLPSQFSVPGGYTGGPSEVGSPYPGSVSVRQSGDSYNVHHFQHQQQPQPQPQQGGYVPYRPPAQELP